MSAPRTTDPRTMADQSGSAARLPYATNPMMRRSLRVVVLACAALFLGCDGSIVEPDFPDAPDARAIRELHLSPAEGTLFTIGIPGTLQLFVTALSDAGEEIDVSRFVTFASSAPAIAIVDESGVVTAVAMGTAKITATVTTGVVTHSASMTVSVMEPPAVSLSGTYDVEALVVCCATSIAGESLKWTGVFTFPGVSGTDSVIGTVTDWQARTLAGEALGGSDSGTILLRFSSGRPYLEIFFPRDPVSLRPYYSVFLTIDDSSGSDPGYANLHGNWLEGDGWGIQGTYTAIRREQ
jgi:hypothetical protein